jgi:antirestriction protein ArdC
MHTDTNNTKHTARQNLQRNPESRDPYALVTARIIECLEKETVPWKQPWHGGILPQNLISRRPYSGINTFILGTSDFESPYFLTYKQAKALGGFVRRGERGLPVIYCSKATVTKENEATGEPESKDIKFLRTYTVFNATQCDGIPVPDPVPLHDFTPIEACERIVNGYQGGPEIVHRAFSAFYRPRLDIVNMPRPETFTPPEEYYSTLFHELVHSTGHESRLKREGIEKAHRFGDPVYTKEELIAEMGSAFLCAHAGIIPATVSQSAAYIRGWLKALQNDKRLVVYAAASAQRAADYILGLTPQQPGAVSGGDEGTNEGEDS